MRKLIYQFNNPKTKEIIEVSTLAQSQEIRKNEFPYEGFTEERIVLIEDSPRLIYDGRNERGIKKYHFETLTEMLARG